MILPRRTVALIGAICLIAGWLLASTLAPPVARVQSLPERAPKAAPVTDDTALTTQLRLRLRRAPTAPSPQRNPFTFAPSRREVTASGARPDASTEAAAFSEAAPPALVGPALSLAGIAVSGDTRTAILTDGRAVHLVAVGQRVEGYEVVEVTDVNATLVDAAGQRWLLALR